MGSKPIIGILTGGGDVPGLNSVIKSVVYRSDELGYEVLGIRRGWMGLTHMMWRTSTMRSVTVLTTPANLAFHYFSKDRKSEGKATLLSAVIGPTFFNRSICSR